MRHIAVSESLSQGFRRFVSWSESSQTTPLSYMPKLDIGLVKLKKMLLEIHKARYCLVLPTTKPDKADPPLKTPYNAHNIHTVLFTAQPALHLLAFFFFDAAVSTTTESSSLVVLIPEVVVLASVEGAASSSFIKPASIEARRFSHHSFSAVVCAWISSSFSRKTVLARISFAD